MGITIKDNSCGHHHRDGVVFRLEDQIDGQMDGWMDWRPPNPIRQREPAAAAIELTNGSCSPNYQFNEPFVYFARPRHDQITRWRLDGE